MSTHELADVTLTLRDTPEGGVVVHTTFKPALGQRLSPAQSLALDLATQASHRADVVHMQVLQPTAADATGYAAEDALIHRALAGDPHHPEDHPMARNQLALELPQ